jgi:hypothetical protein
LFHPERWLDIPAAKYRHMDQTVMMEFASGSRWECLGKTVAQIELNKTFVEVRYPLPLFPAPLNEIDHKMQLLRRFDFTMLDPTNPLKWFNAAVFIQSDMNVVVTRRRSN